jgi:hypothetical protein
VSSVVTTVISLMSRHHRRAFPLMKKFFGEGFRFEATCEDGVIVLEDYMDEMRDDPAAHAERLLAYADRCGGCLTLWLDEMPLVRLVYDRTWQARVVLDLFDDPKLDVNRLREHLADLVDPEDLFEFLDLAIGYLGELTDEPFGYTIEMKNGPFMAASFEGECLCLRLLDVSAWLKMMLFLMKRTDPAALVKSPMEIMRAVEQAQDTLRFMADCYEENDRKFVVRYGADRLFSCGAGVRPTLGSRFGPMALHLDVLASVIKKTMAGR